MKIYKALSITWTLISGLDSDICLTLKKCYKRTGRINIRTKVNVVTLYHTKSLRLNSQMIPTCNVKCEADDCQTSPTGYKTESCGPLSFGVRVGVHREPAKPTNLIAFLMGFLN